LYTKLVPNAKKMKIAINVGQIWSFIHRIKKGDLVILPLRSQPMLAVAEVIGDYEYRENSDYIKHIRNVRFQLVYVPAGPRGLTGLYAFWFV
jgi:restriction system protein